jgi:hypothetical protein
MVDNTPAVSDPPSSQTANRTKRTAFQAGVPTGAVLVAKWVLDSFELSVPDDVLLILLAALITGFASAINFAEDQGWIKDRRTPPAIVTG